MNYHVLEAEALLNVNRLDKALGGRDFNREAMKVADGHHSRVAKLHRLFRLTDEMTREITPHSACRNGCSHCCNMAVSITPMEARELAKASGLRYQEVLHPMPEVRAHQEYLGKPCPFLKEGRCQVYEARPVACRVYFNMSDTPDICNVVEHPNHDVPCFDSRGVRIAQSIALGIGYADIREYFPYTELL